MIYCNGLLLLFVDHDTDDIYSSTKEISFQSTPWVSGTYYFILIFLCVCLLLDTWFNYTQYLAIKCIQILLVDASFSLQGHSNTPPPGWNKRWTLMLIHSTWTKHIHAMRVLIFVLVLIYFIVYMRYMVSGRILFMYTIIWHLTHRLPAGRL